jgi:putative hydrolase
MDAAGEELVPSLPRLRAAMDRRRASPSAPARLLQRLLGLEMKMRQYQLGKAFCDAVVERGGIEALNRVWDGPDAMPTLAELEAPAAWLERTHVPSVTKS